MKRNIPWDLIISKLKDELTASDEQLFEKWLSVAENKGLYEELQEVWKQVRAKAVDYTVDTDSCWNELLCRIGEKEQTKPINKTEEKNNRITDNKNEHKAILFMRKYVAAACILAVLFASASFYFGIKVGRPKVAQQTYTNWGGKSKIVLPDGTTTWVHSKTSLSYNTDFKVEERVVNVSGEAYFDVTYDKNNPFIVQMDGVRVVVHGTKFNVEAFPESDNIYVSLQNGSVSLETAKEQRMLRPGEIATYNKRDQGIQIEKGDVNLAVSWANDQIIFQNKNLGEITQILSKWYNVKINLSPKVKDQFRYTFTLRHEPLEEILRIMSRIHPIEYSFDEENVVTIDKKK